MTSASSTFLSPFVFAYGIAIPTGVGILVAAFLIFPLVERITNAKQVQLMTGLDPATFWLANVSWDVLIYFISLSLMLVVLLGFDDKKTFTTNGAAGNSVLQFK